MSTELTIVVPTLNEAGNIVALADALERALHGIAWNVIFVDDDSTDGTGEVLRTLAQQRPHVRYLRRVGRRGLSSACIEGMLATPAPVIAVMDADLQHDESLLPEMLRRLREKHLDIVVASRFAEGGSAQGLSSASRERMSRLGNRLCRMVMKANVSDPLSGFFMLRRELLDEVVHALSGKGFKILLDIFASARRPLAFDEVGMVFRQRHAGDSKLDTLIILEFAILLADKAVGTVVPIRFVLFVMVGLLGMALHLLLLSAAFLGVGMPFLAAQTLATGGAMLVNFTLDNRFTYRDRRLKGRDFVRGLGLFFVACSIGAVVNFQMAEFLYEGGTPWPIAGLLGAIIGAVWNFGVNSTVTWRRKGPDALSA